MKFRNQLFFIVFIGLFTCHISAQEPGQFKIAFGINAIDNSNAQKGPWAVEKLSFKTPFFIGAEYQVNNKWSFGVNATFNELQVLEEEHTFFAIGADANYYIVSRDARNFIDFYAILGGSINRISVDTGATINPGLGFNYWFSDRLGVNVTTRANFSVEKQENTLVGSYYQYNVGLIWRLGEVAL